MDEISKENILNPEVPTPEATPGVLVPQENTEAQTAPEVPTQEFGEVPTSQPNNNQNDYAEETAGEESYPEEEVAQQISDISSLPEEEEKVARLKEIAQKSSLEKAIRMVKGMNDPELEDKFHDELMDDLDLRVKLEELGKIEKL